MARPTPKPNRVGGEEKKRGGTGAALTPKRGALEGKRPSSRVGAGTYRMRIGAQESLRGPGGRHPPLGTAMTHRHTSPDNHSMHEEDHDARTDGRLHHLPRRLRVGGGLARLVGSGGA